MIINDLDDYYIVFDTKNRNTELDTLKNNCLEDSTKSCIMNYGLCIYLVLLLPIGVDLVHTWSKRFDYRLVL